jgi:formylglycine-generating enzyme required for sulfatase activity
MLEATLKSSISFSIESMTTFAERCRQFRLRVWSLCLDAMLLGSTVLQPTQAQTPSIGELEQRLQKAEEEKARRDGAAPEMVVIPAGIFKMGSPESQAETDYEKPQHQATVRSYLIGKTEVTQSQWRVVMGRNPSRFTKCGHNCPVEQVS